MNEIIKSKMESKNKLYQQYIQNGWFESDLVFIESLIAELKWLNLFVNNNLKMLLFRIYTKKRKFTQ